MSDKDSPNSQDDNDIYFLSTQIQARHEEVVENEKQEKEKQKVISKWSTFRNEDLSEVETSKTYNKVRSAIKKPKGKRKKVANKRTTSLSSLARENYNNVTETYIPENQTKIDNFIKCLNKGDIPEVDISNSTTSSSSNLFTKTDWLYIMQNIKLKCPDLNAKGKKSLKNILKKINIFEEEASVPDSIWSEASSYPENKLSDEDLKWLYDLDEEQMVNNSSVIEDDWHEKQNDSPFVLTLSQALNNSSSDIISDSESEFEILRGNKNRNLITQNGFESNSYTQPYKSNYGNKLVKDSIGSIGSLQFKDSFSDLSPHKKAKVLILQSFEEEISSPKATPNNLPFVVPGSKNSDKSTYEEHNGVGSKEEIIILSDSGSVNSIKKPEEVIISDSENEIVSSIPQVNHDNRKRRLLRTTRVEVLKNLNLSNFEDTSKNVGIKYIGTKTITIDSENEVEDSEGEDDNSLSIIEITREVDTTDMLIDLNSDKDQQKNTSLVQVPSSPEISSEQKDKYSDILNFDFDLDNGLTSETQDPNSQQIANTYMTDSEYYTPLIHFNDESQTSQNTLENDPDTQDPAEQGLSYSHLDFKKSQTKTQKNTQQIEQEYDALTKTLKHSHYWFEKIISFEPLFLDELKDWLNCNDKSTWDKPSLEKYCEKYGITYSNATK